MDFFFFEKLKLNFHCQTQGGVILKISCSQKVIRSQIREKFVITWRKLANIMDLQDDYRYSKKWVKFPYFVWCLTSRVVGVKIIFTSWNITLVLIPGGGREIKVIVGSRSQTGYISQIGAPTGK